MALPILQIAKLLAELTVIAPVVSDGVDKIRKLVETVRKGDANTAKQIDALRQAIELQSSVNKKWMISCELLNPCSKRFKNL